MVLLNLAGISLVEAAGERRNSRQIAAPHGEDVLAARQCAVMCSAAACYGHTAPTFWGVIGLMWMSLGLDALWDRLKNLLPVKPAPVTLRVAVELARRITRYAAARAEKNPRVRTPEYSDNPRKHTTRNRRRSSCYQNCCALLS